MRRDPWWSPTVLRTIFTLITKDKVHPRPPIISIFDGNFSGEVEHCSETPGRTTLDPMKTFGSNNGSLHSSELTGQEGDTDYLDSREDSEPVEVGILYYFWNFHYALHLVGFPYRKSFYSDEQLGLWDEVSKLKYRFPSLELYRNEKISHIKGKGKVVHV